MRLESTHDKRVVLELVAIWRHEAKSLTDSDKLSDRTHGYAMIRCANDLEQVALAP